VELEQQLINWTAPSSATEQDKQDRTERMAREAIAAHASFNDCSLKVYAKGSYANNTNVRADSDVDIAVECMECVYWREESRPPDIVRKWLQSSALFDAVDEGEVGAGVGGAGGGEVGAQAGERSGASGC
jgi:hypothetical protein